MADVSALCSEFRQYLRRKGLRNTPQRERIVDIFLHEGGHLSAEELFERVRRHDASLGQATVYRTLKLLCEAGLAREVRLEDTTARYEPPGETHHDHMVCERCGHTLEVVDPEIERLQEELARRYNFHTTSHRMVLYGICADCRGKKDA